MNVFLAMGKKTANIQLKSLKGCRDCSEKCLYRVWHLSGPPQINGHC